MVNGLLYFLEEAYSLFLYFATYATFLWAPIPPPTLVAWTNPEVAHLGPTFGLLIALIMLVGALVREYGIRRLTGELWGWRTRLSLILGPVLVGCGICLAFFSAAGPSLFESKQDIEYKPACVGVALDVSLSTNAGTMVDGMPYTRLDQARPLITELTSYFKPGTDMMGLLLFSDHVVRPPLFSTDFAIFTGMLDEVTYQVVQNLGTKGSDIVGATKQLFEAFPADMDCQRFALLFSDGEQNKGGVVGVEGVTEASLTLLESANKTQKERFEGDAASFLVILGDPQDEQRRTYENIFEFDEAGNVIGLTISKKSGEFVNTAPDLSVARKIAEVISAKVIVPLREDIGTELTAAVEKAREIKSRTAVVVPWSVAPFAALGAFLFILFGFALAASRR